MQNRRCAKYLTILYAAGRPLNTTMDTAFSRRHRLTRGSLLSISRSSPASCPTRWSHESSVFSIKNSLLSAAWRSRSQRCVERCWSISMDLEAWAQPTISLLYVDRMRTKKMDEKEINSTYGVFPPVVIFEPDAAGSITYHFYFWKRPAGPVAQITDRVPSIVVGTTP